MAAELPASGVMGATDIENDEFQPAIEAFRDFVDQGIGGSPGPVLTIADGAITPTASFHRVDTESAVAQDELTHIDPGDTLPEGVRVFLRLNSGSRHILIKPEEGGVGQIFLDSATAGDLLLSTGYGGILLMKIGTAWRMHSLLVPGGDAPHGLVVDPSSPWTVPDGVHKLWITIIGGGGGGGGGADGSNFGGGGVDGGATSVSTPTGSANGGGGGFGGNPDGSAGGGGEVGGIRYGSNGVSAVTSTPVPGGPATVPPGTGHQPGSSLGFAGQGGDGGSGGGSGGGGAPGQVRQRIEYDVLPTSQVVFSKGNAGTAGTHEGGGDSSDDGLQGGLIIEW